MKRFHPRSGFLDSALFPLVLVVVIPVVALPIWWLRRRAERRAALREEQDDLPPVGFQFRISTLLLITLAVGIFLGVSLWSATGLYSLIMVSAVYAILGTIVFDPLMRLPALAMLLLAGSYGVLNVGVYAAIIAIDAFALFSILFMVTAVIIGPLVMTAVGFLIATWAAGRHGRFPWAAASGFAAVMIGIAVANGWVIFQAMASV